MSELALPKVDQSTILNRDKIVNKLKRIIKSENVLDHNDEIKPYETDALSAYKQKPLAVVLPENTQEVSDILKYCNEEKIKIKKIEKQPTEKKIYNIKDYVVYPKHGVGKIVSIEKAKIGSIDITFYKVFIEKEKLTLSIPLNQQSHLRQISSINQINKAINILKSKPKIKRTMWSRRAQEYEQKINSGKLYELAEVVRDLNKKTDVIAEQSYSERQLFEKAYERLLSEFNIVLGNTLEDTQKKLDKALKRNIEPQAQKPIQKIESSSSDLEVVE